MEDKGKRFRVSLRLSVILCVLCVTPWSRAR
jgi:hypothetical protein